MEGTRSVQKFWLFITPILGKFAMRWKRLRRHEHSPPQTAHCTQAEAVSQMALDGRMTRFITLTFSTNLLGPFWWHLTMSSMSGTDIPRGMKPMDPCLPPLFSPFKKKNQPNPTNHWLIWNILPPHHKQRDTHLNTHKLHIPGGPDPPGLRGISRNAHQWDSLSHCPETQELVSSMGADCPGN